MKEQSYKEYSVHKISEEGCGESDVFCITYPNGEKTCRKEYIPQISQEMIILYHAFHNQLSETTVEIPTNLLFQTRSIKKVIFSVLSLGHAIKEAVRISDREGVIVTDVPYVEGDTVETLESLSDAAYEIRRARDAFLQLLMKKNDLVISKSVAVHQLGERNMKYQVENDTMKVIVTDMLGDISWIYRVCNVACLDLLRILGGIDTLLLPKSES